MAARPAWRTDPRGREQIVLPHQPQHPPQRCPDTAVAQAGPHLAMTFTMERTGGEHGADGAQQRDIRHGADRSATIRRAGL
jgi:hypothetical protein